MEKDTFSCGSTAFSDVAAIFDLPADEFYEFHVHPQKKYAKSPGAEMRGMISNRYLTGLLLIPNKGPCSPQYDKEELFELQRQNALKPALIIERTTVGGRFCKNIIIGRRQRRLFPPPDHCFFRSGDNYHTKNLPTSGGFSLLSKAKIIFLRLLRLRELWQRQPNRRQYEPNGRAERARSTISHDGLYRYGRLQS